jgi:hypothetical protein
MTRLAALPRTARPAPWPERHGGTRAAPASSSLARIDWRGRRASCANAQCGKTITRLVRIGQGAVLRPIFTGEWHEGDDHVWRLTSYARAIRQRASGPEAAAPPTGRALGLTRRRLWSDPTTWPPVVAATPCAVECPACQLTQTIRLG